MSLVLSFDTSADACAVAFRRDGVVVAAVRREMRRGHAEALVPMIVAAAADAGIRLPALDLVGVTVGPGSFTGVRTGLAAANGFGLAAGAPVVGVTCFEAVAARALAESGSALPLLCVLETRRKDYYVQAFAPDGAARTPPAALPAAEIRRLVGDQRMLAAGNAASRLLDAEPGLAAQLRLAAGAGTPDAADVGAIAERRAAEEGVELAPPAPLYLHAPEAKKPRHGGRLRP